jgi:hypothetical protein
MISLLRTFGASSAAYCQGFAHAATSRIASIALVQTTDFPRWNRGREVAPHGNQASFQIRVTPSQSFQLELINDSEEQDATSSETLRLYSRDFLLHEDRGD